MRIFVSFEFESFIGKLYFSITESAPVGTLIMRENFKGCIRNVKINSGSNSMEIIDWTDMHQLHNILLNECLSSSH